MLSSLPEGDHHSRWPEPFGRWLQRARLVVAGDRGPFSGQDLSSVVKLMPLVIVATGLTSLLVVASIWHVVGGPALGWWLTGEIALLLAVTARWLETRDRPIPDTQVSRVTYRRVMFFTVLFAAPWAALALRFVPVGVYADVSLLVSYCLGMAMGGSVLLGRMTLPAIAYIATIVGGVTLACILSPLPTVRAFAIYTPLLGLFLCAVVIAGASLARARDRTIAMLTEANDQLQASQRHIERMALQDPETRLPNRKALNIELTDRLVTWREHPTPEALAVVGVRAFKALNTSYGHAAGEALIAQLMRRLQSELSETEFLARLDSDTFALVLEGFRDDPKVVARLTRILSAMSARTIVLGRTLHPTISAGVVAFSEDVSGCSDLIGRALEAARIADCGGASAVTLYSPSVMQSASEKNAMERDLRIAIARKELQLFYQPKVCLKDRRIIGAEALLRWRHPDRGMQPPDRFLPLAEERGIIPAVSKFVHSQVLDDLQTWRAEGLAHGLIAINAHPVDLDTPGLLIDAFRRFSDAGFGPSDILLEITENCVFGGEGAQAETLLSDIHQLGYQLSLDDFGTGRASLTHLKRLPVSEIKIDREFVNGIGSQPGDEAIVCAALEVARRLKIRSVAEGIETAAQEKTLVDLGCAAAQGYYYSRPIPADEYAALLRTGSPLGERAAA